MLGAIQGGELMNGGFCKRVKGVAGPQGAVGVKLIDRPVGWFPVDHAAAQEKEMADPVRGCGFQGVDGPAHIDFEGIRRPGGKGPGQMVNHLDTFHRGMDGFPVLDIPHDDFQSGMILERIQLACNPVENSNRKTSLEEGFDKVAPDKPAAAGDQEFHFNLL
jgi:hypothetical protein